jgi:cyclic di-GMP phosphodiesterase
METVLLVDDEPMVLEMCTTILKLGGYTVLVASNGAEALRLLQSAGAIDIALLDVMMPGMNGLELAKHIRSSNPAIPIVLMTGYSAEDIAEVVSGNDYRIIWKPFKTASLLQMIENSLGETGRATLNLNYAQRDPVKPHLTRGIDLRVCVRLLSSIR